MILYLVLDPLTSFIFLFLILCMFVRVYMCITYVQCPQRPEEGIWPLKRIKDMCALPMWMLGTERELYKSSQYSTLSHLYRPLLISCCCFFIFLTIKVIFFLNLWIWAVSLKVGSRDALDNDKGFVYYWLIGNLTCTPAVFTFQSFLVYHPLQRKVHCVLSVYSLKRGQTPSSHP